ncbi:MAG: hypothetical protein MJZ82_01940 [Paludibacteraceae bacterium]|nr:hypothetical protein [Paludibacteraceae bacterium]
MESDCLNTSFISANQSVTNGNQLGAFLHVCNRMGNLLCSDLFALLVVGIEFRAVIVK